MTASSVNRRTALVTASYAGDLERCRLLCETVDHHVRGHDHHYLLVAGHDMKLFRDLERPRRTVVDERDLLPSWLHCFPDPIAGGGKRIWLSLRTLPLRGWHVQQLRRIAIASHVDQEALLYCDSDVAFVRDFDCDTLWDGDDLRLFRREGGLRRSGLDQQRLWSENAGRVLGIAGSRTSEHDYIATVIAWRRDAADAMRRRIEAVSGRDWVAAVAASRQFSECMMYGRFADDVQSGAGHFHDERELCRVYWTGLALSDQTFREFIAAMTPEQVAIGVQSFIGTDVGRIRRWLAA